MEAFNQAKSIFPGMCDSFQLAYFESPDENWIAQDCFGDSLQIINRNGLATRKVTYKEIFGASEYYPYNQGALYPVHWTNDSQYLYFSAQSCCWDPFILLLSEMSTLYRINIKSGEHTLLRTGLFDVSFAPTDRRITYIQELTRPVVEIQDVATGTVNKVKLNSDDRYNQASVDAWSSDGLQFAVSTASGSLYDYTLTEDVPATFSVFIIDINTLSQKPILKDTQTVYLKVIDWSKDNVLTFQTGHPSWTEPIRIWQYDLKTDTLYPPIPTP